jgi:hypothetical protein
MLFPFTPRSTSPKHSNTDFTAIAYPNPVKDVLTVSIPATTGKVDLLNAMGETLNQMFLENGNSLNVYNLPPGVYFLRIEGIDEVVKFAKL